MELLRSDQLESLIEPASGPCVSIYLPTHRSGVETKQGAIRLKNQLREAEQQIAGQGMRPADARKLLEPVQKLCDNNGFWLYQSEGLALFRSPEKFLYYRLPLRFEELLVVSERFHVKPLLRLFSEDGRYYVLALSKNEVRFLQCTRFGVRQIGLPEGTPGSLKQVRSAAGIEKQVQVHTAGAATKFHGHGSREDQEKDELRGFFRLVDKGVRAVLRDDRAPLVLAGVEYLLAIYRECNGHPRLIDGGVTGNPEGRRPEDLQSDAWGLVEPWFRRAREQAARRFREVAGTTRASTDIRQVLPAAFNSRIEELFVAVGFQLWGGYDEAAAAVRLSETKRPGDRDLLNLAAIQSLLHGGAVYAVAPEEVPGGTPLAAVFRY